MPNSTGSNSEIPSDTGTGSSYMPNSGSSYQPSGSSDQPGGTAGSDMP